MLKEKIVIVIGERDGVQGPAIAECMEAAGAEVRFAITECFVWTAAGTMDAENQGNIKKIYEAEEASGSVDRLLVILGSSDIEGSKIYAETVTVGDPGYAGPLAGVSLGLPVYHILEPVIAEAVPNDVYDQNVGIMAMTEDVEKIGKEFKIIRGSVSKNN